MSRFQDGASQLYTKPPPGAGKTKTARLWTYARDERPWAGNAPSAAWYRFSTDRKGVRPRDHLKDFEGWMHADGYAGFEYLYRTGKIYEVACMAHIRRKFVDVHKSQGSAIAEEAIKRIAELYAPSRRKHAVNRPIKGYVSDREKHSRYSMISTSG